MSVKNNWKNIFQNIYTKGNLVIFHKLKRISICFYTIRLFYSRF